MSSPARRFWYSCLAVLFTSPTLWAGAPADPLTFVPQQADIIAKIENLRHLVETGYNLEAVKEIQKVGVVKEQLESTNARRFYQLINYFESKLGASKFELLDKLAGGGVVFAAKVAKKPSLLLVIQGKEEKTTKEFVQLALEVLEQELERQEKNIKIVKKDYNGVEAYKIANKLYLARMGATILASNQAEVLKATVDMRLGKSKEKNITTNENLAKARTMLAKELMAWAWVNLESLRKLPGSEDFFETPLKNSQINYTFAGGMIDVARRSPFLCAGLHQKQNRFMYTVQMPAGLKGMPEKVAGWFPKKQGTTLPLLEPPNVLSSASMYFDLAEVWKNRDKLLADYEVKNLEDADKQSGKFLGGVRVSALMKMSGVHYRFVLTQPTSSVYNTKSTFPLQAYGLVGEMRDPEVAKKLDRVLRTAAIFGAAQFNLKLVELKHKGVDVVSYRFPEDKEIKADMQKIRFNFSPSYAWVGDQFIAASTFELAKDLIEAVQKEGDAKPVPVLFQSKFYSTGLATILRTFKDQITTEFVLGQAIPLEDASEQVERLIEIVENLGTATAETNYSANRFRLDVTVDLGK